MPIIIPANSAAAGGDFVTNGVRFNTQSSTEYMQRNMSNTGNLQAWTVSVWVKRSVISDGQHMLFASYYNSSNSTECFFEGNDSLNFRDNEGGSFVFQKKTTQRFRDPSAWYHLVMSSSAGAQKIYVNGVEVTAFNDNTNGSGTSTWNNDKSHAIAANVNGGADKAGLYMAEFTSIDGQTLTASSFGEFDEDSGIWVPKDVTELTFGTNGFYLPFSNSSALGEDFSGNNLDFPTNNMDATNQVTDTCTNNFSVFNPLLPTQSGIVTPAFSDGNLTSLFDNGGTNEFAMSTIAVASGKWYAEFKWVSATGTGATSVGVIKTDANFNTDPNDNGIAYKGNGQKNIGGSSSSYGASYGAGNIISVALNMDDNQITFYKDGASQGAISITADLTYYIFCSDYNNKTVSANFGSPPYAISSGNTDGNGRGNFEYAVPSGYLALCTKNLSEELS